MTVNDTASDKRELLRQLLEKKARQPQRLPLSHGQRAMWFLYQMEPDSAAYHILFAGRLPSTPDLEVLNRALKKLMRRHPALRTTFEQTAESLEQIVHPQLEVPLTVIPAHAETEEELYEHVMTMARTPFDLTRGPLFRVVVFEREESPVLLIAIHHIISDYWSLSVLLDELGLLFAEEKSGVSAELPAIRSTYGEYVNWQNEHLQGPAGRRNHDFWTETLAGELPVLRLTTDKPRPPVQTFNGKGITFELPEALVEQVETLSRAESVTSYVTLLAAFQILLARYTGQEELLIGSPTAGRSRPEFEGVIGYYANPVIMRTRLQPQQSFRQLLQDLRGVVLDAISNQDYPFPLLVDEFQRERDASRSPLFQTMFAFQKAPRLEEQDFSLFMIGDPDARLNLQGLELFPYPVPQQEGQFDLTLTMIKHGTAIRAAFLYNTDLFEASTIQHMSENFCQLLTALTETPDQPVHALNLLSAQERRLLLTEWGRPRLSLSTETALETFEAQARQNPQATALYCEGESLSYAELLQKADQVAVLLRSRGVQPQDTIGMMLERSASAVIAMLGILKAGGVYVPLDPAYPPERLHYMIDDSRVRFLLSRRSLADSYASSALDVLDMDDLLAMNTDPDTSIEMPTPRGDQPAYIIYTSGSTGTPKGVVVNHQALAQQAQTIREYHQLTGADRVLQFSSLNFDTSLEQLFSAFTAGAAVVMRGDALWSSQELRTNFEQYRVSVANLPTAYWHQIVHEWKTMNIEFPSSLRLMIPGGEALLPRHVQLWRELPTQNIRLINAYGPTETVVTSHSFEIAPDTPLQQEKAVPIGRSLGDRVSYVLDANGQLVPVGVPGELHIGGSTLAHGYLHQPELTAQKFVQDPFSDDPNARMYKTGDLVRYLPDGHLEFLGRIDKQVKIRGFRIEIEEIEANLLQHPSVAGACVVVREDEPGSKRLVAYLVPAHDEPHTSELRRFARSKLPDYSVPSAFVWLPEFPLTANGKINRNALPAPESVEQTDRTDGASPRTETETVLAAIWGQVLKKEHVGIHDNFFELGGDSILGLQMIMQAGQAGIHLTPKQLFEYQTIAELGEVAGLATSKIVAETGLVEGDVPLTPIQHWFFEQTLPERHHFNQSVLLESSTPLDAGLLHQSLLALLAHHDALRSKYRLVDGIWQQTVTGSVAEVPFQTVDLHSLSADEQEKLIEQTAAQAQASLSLEDGRLLHAVLFNRGPEQPGLLLLVIHHLVVDGVSWRILLEDLQLSYQQLQAGQPVQLPAKTTSFQYWAQRLAAHAKTEEVRSELAYWQHRPAAAPVLPRDLERGPNTEGSTQTVTVSLSDEETSALLHRSLRTYRAQINELLLTALAKSLSDWTGQSASLIELEGHGREDLFDDVDLTRTVGWFTSVFPVQLDLREASTLIQAIQAVKEQLRAIPKRGIGYGLLRCLQEEDSVRRELQQLPVAEVTFNYLGQFDDADGSSALRISPRSSGPMRSATGIRSSLLNFDGSLLNNRLQFEITYSTNLHHHETMEWLANRFLAHLRDIISTSETPGVCALTPSDFPLADLTQAKVDSLAAAYPHLEDLFPMTPTQQGMLFRTLASPGRKIYHAQLDCLLEGPLDVARFQQSWQYVQDKHPTFRTLFVWKDLDVPMQAVLQETEQQWQMIDLRHLSPEEQLVELDSFLEADRNQPFALDREPLMRFTLLRLAEERHHFVWSHHHLHIDGWSLALALTDAMRRYEEHASSPLQERARSYRDYVRWLSAQSMSEAQSYWTGRLQGYRSPSRLQLPAAPPGTPSAWSNRDIQLSLEETNALHALSRQAQLTPNTILQGVWALLTAHFSGQDDVVYGVTTSGRPMELRGADSIIGMFVNSLPTRIQIPQNGSVAEWLRAIQTAQAEARQYEFTPLSRVQSWSDLPHGEDLFESVFVFENYPLDRSIMQVNGLRAHQPRSTLNPGYTLCLRIMPGDELHVLLEFDKATFAAQGIETLLNLMRQLLVTLHEHLHQDLSEWRDVLRQKHQQELDRLQKDAQQRKLSKLRERRNKS
ncbi:non-ribosomal peptide synthetase [Tumebacillus flagellatus]|uniref:Carrier domain-containing protein n=1 Tax=Tumebacillus flagellatus TaxID=1157490 RepID=A0A074M9F6_9BACL|nr:non-ribosomal peptide synthetase [Tumebacillus flagellatus]KEO82567.1 hypothetical protein EL26_14365 [Tumebacillus flagellatus]